MRAPTTAASLLALVAMTPGLARAEPHASDLANLELLLLLMLAHVLVAVALLVLLVRRRIDALRFVLFLVLGFALWALAVNSPINRFWLTVVMLGFPVPFFLRMTPRRES
jgi:Na+/H+ antiporter NhaA